jgi:type VI protein secretion system component Hcp
VLTNANISNLSIYSAREQGELATYAEFSMTYQQIGIEDFESGLSYEDSWESPTF